MHKSKATFAIKTKKYYVYPMVLKNGFPVAVTLQKCILPYTKTPTGQANVFTYNDYYPYGSIARSGGTTYRYEYQGAYAEKDPITGFNNFELRMYDGRIGRWLSIDPNAQYYSPYEGMGNNPVSRSDPDGGYDTKEAAQQAGKAAGVDPSDIYNNGGKSGWGYNTSIENGIVGHFGPSKVESSGGGFNFKAGFSINEGAGVEIALSKAICVNAVIDKHAVSDLGYSYSYSNRSGGSRPNGKDATVIGGGLGIGWAGASYDLNAVYNDKNKTFTNEHVIGIGAFGILGGEVVLNPNGSFKGATLGIDVNPSFLFIYGAEASLKTGWKWGK